MFVVGPIAPLITNDFQIANKTVGLLTSVIFFDQFLFAIPASVIVGRLGPKFVLGLGACLGSAPLLIFLAADNYYLLLGIRACFGMGLVLIFPALGPLYMQWFRANELPLVMGSFIIAIVLGITASAYIVVPLSEKLGWEVALSGLGVVSLSGALAWILFGKAQAPPIVNKPSLVINRIWTVLGQRNTLLIIAADAGPYALVTVSAVWLPTFYHETYGISLRTGGALIGFMSLAGLFSLILASLLTIRTSRRKPFLVIPGILTGIAGLASFLVVDPVLMYLAVGVLGFACWFYLPALMTIPMDLFPKDPNQVALIFAAMLSLGGVASAIAPPIVGAIADATGSMIPGLAIFALFGWSLGIAGILLPETGVVRRTEKRA
jgi:ACS family hexuronate transporter-like MFS transporter